jgi:3'-phosphoadenosine 5'-phosphosulfate sulfotransferase (PAPS reductase)/FAD synthetase
VIHVAAFSGGKDSTALLLWLRGQGIEHTTVFCDTGWEHPLTYAYVEEINQRLLGGGLVVLKPDEWVPAGTTETYHDMRDLVSRKGRVPSVRARFCTEYLKTNPMRAYLAALDDVVTVYQGIRAEESANRAAMGSSCWSDYYDCQVERPLFLWSAAEVFAFLDRHGIPANPLYRLGAKRVGCFPCVLTRHAELKRLSAMLPEVWQRIEELERLSGRSYFPPGFIPDRYCSHHEARTVEVSGEEETEPLLFVLEGGRERIVERIAYWPSVADVRRYLSDAGQEELDRFGETPSCLSVYNLCE